MISLENIPKHELIGLKTIISDSTNKQIVGLNGTVVDETKSMFIINTKNGFKMIQKKHNTWKFLVNNKETTLSGALFEKRSFDRLETKI
jgi:ribonuclease P protein subunit POP4